MKSNIYIVSGGAGFIGYHLCKKLLDEDEDNIVICIDNLITGSKDNIIQNDDRYIFLQMDICTEFENIKRKLFNEFNFIFWEGSIRYIYHLASLASPDKYKLYPLNTLDVSYIGTKNMLELAKDINASSLLFTSTSEIYGDPLIHPQDESYYGNVNTVGERSCYDEGKRIGETLCYVYKKKYKIDIRIVRIFNTYGPRMDLNDGRVITNFLKSIKESKPLNIYGDGNQTRSFCYVDDMVNGLLAMMNNSSFKKESVLPIINLGNPNMELNLLELATLVIKIFKNKDFTLNNLNNIGDYIQFLPLTENDPKIRCPEINKAKSILNWEPKISLEDGITQTAAAFNISPIL